MFFDSEQTEYAAWETERHSGFTAFVIGWFLGGIVKKRLRRIRANRRR